MIYDQYQSSLREFKNYHDAINTYDPKIANAVSYQPSIKLFLFTPKNLSFQCKRPLLLNLDLHVIDAAEKFIARTMHEHSNIYKSSMMTDIPETYGAILPTVQGIPMNTDFMSDNWTFMLVVDNERLNGDLTNLVSSFNSLYNMDQRNVRKIYVGFCIGEPLSFNNTLNLDCVLSITHYSHINEEIKDGHYGSLKDNKVLSNVDIIHPSVNNMVDTPLYKTDIASLRTSITIDNKGVPVDKYIQSFNNQYDYEHAYGDTTENQIIGVPNNTSYGEVSVSTNIYDSIHSEQENGLIIINDSSSQLDPVTPIKYQSIMNSPRHSFQNIIRSTAEALYNSSLQDTENLFGTGSHMDKPLIRQSINNISATMMQPSNLSSSIITDKPFTIKTLQDSYPDIIINKVEIPKFNEFDAYDQSISNITNQMSSLVSTTIPPILSNIGLLSIAFRYCSVTQGNYGLSNIGEYELWNIETYTQLNNNMIKHKWELLKHHLEKVLFTSIRMVAGDFDLMCSCSNSATNMIMINFFQYNGINNHIYESSNRLGGFNSPLIGDKDVFYNNANQLAHFTETMLAF